MRWAVDMLLLVLVLIIVSAGAMYAQIEQTRETVDGDHRRVERKNAFGQLAGRQEDWHREKLLQESFYSRGEFQWRKRYLPDRLEYTYEDSDYQLVTEVYQGGCLIGRWK